MHEGKGNRTNFTCLHQVISDEELFTPGYLKFIVVIIDAYFWLNMFNIQGMSERIFLTVLQLLLKQEC